MDRVYDVKAEVYKLLKKQQDALRLLMERHGIDTQNVELLTSDVAKTIDSLMETCGIDYLHVLIHLLTSANNGSITERICVSEPVIPLELMRNVLHEVGLKPVIINTANMTYEHCVDKPNDWLVVSYTQQKEPDEVKLVHSENCKCTLTNAPDLPIQRNIYDELASLSNTEFNWNDVRCSNSIKVWWDKLVGRLSPECNLVWPALANLQYVSQPVISIFPVIARTDTVDRCIQQMNLYNRCWPRVERACGYVSQGVYMTWDSSIVLSKHVVVAGITLSIIHEHVRTGESNIDEELVELSKEERYIRHRTILEPMLSIAKKVKPKFEFSEYSARNILKLVQRIGQLFEDSASQLKDVHVVKPKTGYDATKIKQILEDQMNTSSRLDLEFTHLVENELIKVETAILAYIEFDSLKSYRESDYQCSTGARVVDTWAMCSLSHVAMSSQAAWAEAYDDGDKLVAAIVFSNMKQAIYEARKWAVCPKDVHPFKQLMHMSRPIWNTSKYSGPCGVIEIKCSECMTNNHIKRFSWPGWWLSMCPTDTVSKAMKILRCTKQEKERWYANQQKISLESFAGIGVLQVEYETECNKLINDKKYDVIVLSNTNWMTVSGTNSLHSSSHDDK